MPYGTLFIIRLHENAALIAHCFSNIYKKNLALADKNKRFHLDLFMYYKLAFVLNGHACLQYRRSDIYSTE